MARRRPIPSAPETGRRAGAGTRHFLTPESRIQRHIKRMDRLVAKGDPRAFDPDFRSQEFANVIAKIGNPYTR